MTIRYNVNSRVPLCLGHQFDHKANIVTFDGCAPSDAGTMYFKLDADKKYLIPLADMSWLITQPMTLHAGDFAGQLVEITGNGEKIDHGDKFRVTVLQSIEMGEEAEIHDPTLDLWASKLTALYVAVDRDEQARKTAEASRETAEAERVESARQSIKAVQDEIADLQRRVADGEFNGKDGKDGQKGEKGDKGDDYILTESDKHDIADMVDIDGKLDKPADVPVVGKVLKVKAVNEDGSFSTEWASGGSGGGYDDTEIRKEIADVDSRLSESITEISDNTPIIYGDLFGEFENVKSNRNIWLDTSRYAYISKDKPNSRDSYVESVTMYLETNVSYANQRNVVFTFVSFDLNGNSIVDIEEIESIAICVSANENIYTFKFKNKYFLRKGKYIGFRSEYPSGEAPNRIGSVYPDNNCNYGVLVFNASGVRVDNIPTWNVGIDFKMVNELEWLHSRPLFGKKWVAYGDSITAGYGLRGFSDGQQIYGGATAESYVKKIADDFGMSFLNYGQSARGYSLSQSWNGEKIVSTLYDNTADIVTIAFGTNDFGEVSSFPTEFGNVEGTDTDTTNFCGAVRKTYDTIKQKYTDVKTNVFVLLPISRKTENTPNANGKVLKDYVDVIRTIANKYHFPVLDMWNNSGFKATQTNFADEYYQEGSAGALHPNEKGQSKYFVPIVKRFLIDNYRE